VGKDCRVALQEILGTHTPRRKAAKAFVSLYMALQTCHETFNDYERIRSTEAFVRWDKAVDALAGLLYDLRSVLHIYDPEVYGMIVAYTVDEHECNYVELIAKQELDRFKEGFTAQTGGFAPSEIFSAAIERYNERVSRLRTISKGGLCYGPSGTIFLLDGFGLAIEKLRQFIKDNFKIEEII
jgi:hypothetical protein